MGSYFLLQGIFPMQELNLHLLHWWVDSLPLSHLVNIYMSTLKEIDPEYSLEGLILKLK